MAFARNFQKHFKDKGMIIYIKSEGRFSPEMIQRSGIDTDPEKFFVFDCNIFEKVFELIRELVSITKKIKDICLSLIAWMHYVE
jgi:hypothetical protein